MNIVVIGAHPDDMECSCGGLVLKAVADGHKVHILVVTNGDKHGMIPDGAVLPEVRMNEALTASAIAGAEAHFVGYSDRELPYNEEAVRLIFEQLVELKADFALAHWPADSHPDHQVCGVLATQALLALPDTALAYFEAAVGEQTFGMVANRYFDISDCIERKLEMIRCHVSQDPEEIIPCYELMWRWYGAVIGTGYAEGYYMHRPSREAEEFLARSGRPRG